MAKKTRLRVGMDFEKNQLNGTATLMGLSFFLRMVYYLGFTRPEALGFGNLLIFLILPVLLEAAFMVLLRGMQHNAPQLYGILGAVYCLMLIFQSSQYGNVLRTVLAVLAYLLCGGALLATVFGLLNKSITASLCILTAVVRLLFFDLGYYIFELHLIAFLPEAAAISAILALGILSMGIKVEKRA